MESPLFRNPACAWAFASDSSHIQTRPVLQLKTWGSQALCAVAKLIGRAARGFHLPRSLVGWPECVAEVVVFVTRQKRPEKWVWRVSWFIARCTSWLTPGTPCHSAKESLKSSLRRGSVFSLAVRKGVCGALCDGSAFAPVEIESRKWSEGGGERGKEGGGRHLLKFPGRGECPFCCPNCSTFHTCSVHLSWRGSAEGRRRGNGTTGCFRK